MIDARNQYLPGADQQAIVVQNALAVCGSVNELCERSGLSRDYLNRLRKGQKTWTFQVQYLLESIANKK